MNLGALFRTISTVRDFQQQISEEAAEYDQEHQVEAKITKQISKVVVFGKVVGTAMAFSELPIDLFPGLEGWEARIEAFGVVMFLGASLLGYLALNGESEKQSQRDQAFPKVMKNFNQQYQQRIQQKREHRQKSQYLHDI